MTKWVVPPPRPLSDSRLIVADSSNWEVNTIPIFVAEGGRKECPCFPRSRRMEINCLKSNSCRLSPRKDWLNKWRMNFQVLIKSRRLKPWHELSLQWWEATMWMPSGRVKNYHPGHTGSVWNLMRPASLVLVQVASYRIYTTWYPWYTLSFLLLKQ